MNRKCKAHCYFEIVFTFHMQTVGPYGGPQMYPKVLMIHLLHLQWSMNFPVPLEKRKKYDISLTEDKREFKSDALKKVQ